MDLLLLFLVPAALLVALFACALIAWRLRIRMRSGRFRGFQSGVGGSAFMGAPDEFDARSANSTVQPPPYSSSSTYRPRPPSDDNYPTVGGST